MWTLPGFVDIPQLQIEIHKLFNFARLQFYHWVIVENFSQILQVAWNVDVSKNSIIAGFYMRDICCISLQQMSCSLIPLQRQQLFEIMRGKADRMSEPANSALRTPAIAPAGTAGISARLISQPPQSDKVTSAKNLLHNG